MDFVAEILISGMVAKNQFDGLGFNAVIEHCGRGVGIDVPDGRRSNARLAQGVLHGRRAMPSPFSQGAVMW